MRYSDILSRLRKERGLTQADAASFISKYSDRMFTNKNISSWETGFAMPPIEQFLLLCELYGVRDIQDTFRGVRPEYRSLKKLNALGRSRVEEYIAMLSGNSLFAEADDGLKLPRRVIKLFDIPAAAGTGSFLDSDSYEDFEADETVPPDADYAVKVSGDSMTPRFVDGQIVFVKEQQVLEVGDIGIFALDGDSFIKKLGRGKLVSLNPRYSPLTIHDYSAFYILGKVVG